MTDIIPVEPRRGDEVQTARPDEPIVGRWYWVTSKDEDKEERHIACVTRLGSNYVKLTYVGGETSVRIHNERFWSRCEFIEDADTLLKANAQRCERELNGLLEEVKLLTTRLGVAPGLSLTNGEASATALALASDVPANEYKAALTKAKEETLPALFKQIKEKSAEFATWLSASVIPLKAEAKKLEPAIEKIEDRIFSVELYAGLCETVSQIRKGEPAALTEPVHLFQRKIFMDEECLANYDTGGMEFKTIKEFDRWLLRKDNLDRILPFPRTIVAFQVRRHKKDREIRGFHDFIHMLDAERFDKLTFLYIRNGEQVFWLQTEVEFDEKLFPDLDHPVLSAGEGKLYANLSSFGGGPRVIGEAEYLEKVAEEKAAYEEYKRKVAEERKKPEKKREHIWSPHFSDESSNYEPFTKESVQYDDIAKFIQKQMEEHNRIVLILQGLLDRSPTLHPHPPWRLFDGDGFRQALKLHRDSDRVLVAGDKPNFEAYRAKLNASITTRTVTIGQEEAWLRFEARKESRRRDYDRRWERVDYRPSKWRPDGDPGPGRFARVAKLDRNGYVHYRWTKERKKGDGPEVMRKYACKSDRVFNVEAYKSGDYKIFFADPRTREEYLQWAPFLLAAEEYHAGRYEKVPAIVGVPERVKGPERTGAAAALRAKRSLLGKAVRLTRDITTKGGTKYKKGSLWRVTWLERQGFTIDGLGPDGKPEGRERGIRCLGQYDFEVDGSIASDPKYEYKPEKRKVVSHIDGDGDEEDEG